ncbi:hypothetical protein NXV28_00125 [Bacteroides ovatus]|uniref:hypothetical protein n=1 Tax=Bacteroides ovatus TaxID=28116 RepID=UPI002166BF0F|nr:hypothetical protein [Bacteroides ovatus]MCS2799152.1 hypothetical protein [Bacteroides ovatus]
MRIFEAWNWACYLWLYNQTQYEPLLERSQKALIYDDGFLSQTMVVDKWYTAGKSSYDSSIG